MSTHVHSSLSALVAHDLVRAYGDRLVLDGVDLVAHPGRPLGLVGENGAGKSTLLRLLAGVEPADGGTIAVPADLAYLGQEPAFPTAATVGDVLDEALAPLHDVVTELEQLSSRLEDDGIHEQYARTLEWATLHDAWDADHRAEQSAARLGLGHVDRAQPVASMSGGERMRLALAALLTRRPECVLLDEPTNHLDDSAVTVLEELLAALPGVVVVASHDRTFLENVCTTILDLDPRHLGVDGDGGNRFSGGYSAYLETKRASRARWEAAFLAHQEELDGLRQAATSTARSVGHNRAPRDNDKFVHHKQGQNVAKTVSRRVRDAEQRIEALERRRVPKPPRPLSIADPHTTGRATARVHARDLVVPARLELARLDVPPGERLLVTGVNGSGKSTLLKVLAGEVRAQGVLQVTARRIGHLGQEVSFGRPDRSVSEVYDGAVGSGVALAELGLVHPRDLSRPVGVLSIGQQRRLALAIIVARRPDLLLLDEPTNHISLSLADELEEALRSSAGTVVVASHDRWLRRRWAGSLLRL